MATITPMATKPWNIGEPGGPAGPFYSVVTQTGGIVALQVITREMAERIASIPVLTDKVDRTQYELGAARRQYEGSQSALTKALAELTEAQAEIDRLTGIISEATVLIDDAWGDSCGEALADVRSTLGQVGI